MNTPGWAKGKNKMASRTVTHKQYQRDYDDGYETAQNDLRSDSFETVRDHLNNCDLVGEKFNSLKWYYYASGYMDGILDSL